VSRAINNHAATSLADAISCLKDSERFLNWNPKRPTSKPTDLLTFQMAERHYSPDEIAELWGVSVDSIRRIFRDEPGVLKMGEKSPKHKRQYLTLRIPESVAERVHTRLSE